MTKATARTIRQLTDRIEALKAESNDATCQRFPLARRHVLNALHEAEQHLSWVREYGAPDETEYLINRPSV